MNKNQKGIAHLIPLLLVVILVGASGWWFWRNDKLNITVEGPTPTPTSTETQNINTDNEVPENWKTYSLAQYTFKYPPNFLLNEDESSEVAARLESQDIDTITFSLILDGAGFGFQCFDQIREETIELNENEVKQYLYQGKSSGEIPCTQDKSDEYIFLLNLEPEKSDNDYIFYHIKSIDITYDEAERIFNQILSTFESTENNQTDTLNWQTYTNTRYDYKVKLPPSWEPNRGPGNISDTELKRARDVDYYDPALASGSISEPGRGVSIKVNQLDAEGNDKNCDGINDCISQSLEWLTIDYELTDTTLDGKSAKKMQYQRDTEIYSQTWHYVFTINDDDFYSLSISSATQDADQTSDLFNQILSTFEFAEDE